MVGFTHSRRLIMKKILGWLHLWLGLASGLIVVLVALSGSLLVFEDELQHLFQPSLYKVEVAGDRMSLDALSALVKERYPTLQPNNIAIEPAANSTVIFYLKKSKAKADHLMVVMNPYSGQIIKAMDYKKRFFVIVENLHRYLCMGDVGKAITGVSCFCFTLIIISGIVLWWPKKKNRQQRMQVKWNASFKRLNWDLHAVFGFYVSIFIFIIAITGLIWSYKWMNNLLFLAFDGKVPVAKSEQVPKVKAVKNGEVAWLDKIVATTNRELPYQGIINIRFPEKKEIAITVGKENLDKVIRHSIDLLYFQVGTGELAGKRLLENETNGAKARRLIYPIHTGRLLGWPTKILALLCALTAATLPVTGFLIWWGKQKKKKPAGKNKTVIKVRPKPAVTH